MNKLNIISKLRLHKTNIINNYHKLRERNFQIQKIGENTCLEGRYECKNFIGCFWENTGNHTYLQKN